MRKKVSLVFDGGSGQGNRGNLSTKDEKYHKIETVHDESFTFNIGTCKAPVVMKEIW
ncbi:MAG: hypothetical protein IPF70_10895 [Saprospiraceae bacterium]|nr:hypothetical protein [Saprospiraceae bacterium]